MKNKWSNYALKDGKVKESYLRERIGRDKNRKATEASSSNSPQQSREKQEEITDQTNFTLSEEKDSMSKAKLGSGARFKAVEKKAAASGAENPAGVAAAAGMKKYGKEKMEKMSKAGKSKQ